MPSITTWTRVEPNPRNPKMESSLQAAVADPLWMLARQWQLGEFEGDDAGSPALARFQAECAPLSQFEPQAGAPVRPQPTTFTKFGITDFDVQYWDGIRWSTVPGGSVAGNNKVWVKLKFPAVYTDRIRVVVNKALMAHSRIVEVEAYQSTPQPSDRDLLWVDEDIPAGATPHVTDDQWSWITANPAPFGGTRAHQSAIFNGRHQHFFENATVTLPVNAGDTLFAYVFLDPANPPAEVMLQWNDGTWEHRAYWGEDRIDWGVAGTVSRRHMGPLPPAGQWVRLEVPAALVGLEGRTLRGMAFTLYGGRVTWDRAGKSQPLAPGIGLFAEYFDNVDLTSLRATRIDPAINFEWGTNAPDPAIGADTFSARWSGQVVPLYTEQYTFHTLADDGVRLWVDGQLLVNEWSDRAPTESSGTIQLTAGQKYDIRMEYYENGGAATAKLLWSSPRQTKQVIPQTQLYPPPSFKVPPVNVALATAGAVASASSTHSAGFPPQGAINGDRKGLGWEKGGGWNDATPDAYPDWLQVNFNGVKLIEEVGVVTLQDDMFNPVEPIPYTHGSAQPYQVVNTPLETLVERERVRGEENLRLAAEAGLHFLRLLAAHGVGQYRRAYVNQYALATPPASARTDDDSTRFASLVSRRVPDGQRLYADLR
ncbi:MAG TPA: PA14 domain-containing protein, partial [Pyrinomonadaceae bacterium]